MRIDIIWNDETTAIDLADGVVSVGGAPGDGIHIAGLPHSLLKLKLEGASLSVTALRSIRIGNALFPARVPRLLVEGEDLKLPNDVVIRRVVDEKKQESRKTVGTAFVAQELLNGSELDMQQTRAATFVCVTGLDQGRVFTVPFDENVIGRADEAAIRVRDRAVSRRQAMVVRSGRDYAIRPVSSAMNGAFLNGKLIKKEHLLKTGDIVEVGQTVLRFENAARGPEERTVVETKKEPPRPAKPELAPRPIPQTNGERREALAPPKAAEPAAPALELEEAPTTIKPKAKRVVSVETALMSAGVLLTFLGVVVTVLVLR